MASETFRERLPVSFGWLMAASFGLLLPIGIAYNWTQGDFEPGYSIAHLLSADANVESWVSALAYNGPQTLLLMPGLLIGLSIGIRKGDRSGFLLAGASAFAWTFYTLIQGLG